eukprot:TRINITY_DN20186_c0_g1_i1.p1 TRINITY_DN20186_c0_g1~~TRINITY_DN20186_c0_g1_i1.p1  ORF type:complete len:887 (+),score=174.96 TRINITY_DN20186_c0_g1_i1:92-2752(+)
MGCCGGRSCVDSSGSQDSRESQSKVSFRVPAEHVSPINNKPESGAMQQADSVPDPQSAATVPVNDPDSVTVERPNNEPDSERMKVRTGPDPVTPMLVTSNAPYGGPDDRRPDWGFPNEFRGASPGGGAPRALSAAVPVDMQVWDTKTTGTASPGAASSSASRWNPATQRGELHKEKEKRMKKVVENTKKEMEKRGCEKTKDKDKKNGKDEGKDMGRENGKGQLPAMHALDQRAHPGRADPEQGGPLQSLGYRGTAGKGSACTKKMSAPRPTGTAVAKTAQRPPAAAPEKVSMFTKIRRRFQTAAPPGPGHAVGKHARSSKTAIFSRPQKLASAELCRPAAGGMRVHGAGAPRGSRPPVATPLPIRRPFMRQRPVRPGNPAVPQVQPTVAPLPGKATEDVPPQEPSRSDALPSLEPSPPPPHGMGSAASLQGSFSAEGTSPGHSPLPELAPVRRLVVPSAPAPADAAQQRELSPVLPVPAEPDVAQETGSQAGGERSDQKNESRRVSSDSDYGPGGFCQLTSGEIVEGMEVRSLIGEGGFGAVWRVADRLSGTEYALKVGKSAPRYRVGAEAEVDALREVDLFAQKTKKKLLKGFRERIVETHDFFRIPGRDGEEHMCIMMEALGPDLAALGWWHNDQGVAAPIVKVIMTQVFQALQLLSAMDLAHGDLKPDNVLLTSRCREGSLASDGMTDLGKARLHGDYLRPRQGQTLAQCLMEQYAVKVVDFGKSMHCQGQRPTAMLQTLEYRSPEVVNGARRISPSVDVWSAGCMCYELLTGRYLFPVNDHKTPELKLHSKLWILWINTFGHPPRSLTLPDYYPCAPWFFDAHGGLLKRTQPKSRTLQQLVEGRVAARQQRPLIDFLHSMLQYLPERRVLPQNALQHRWLRV